MLTHGQYAWAKRTLNKEFPEVVEILIRQAAEHGFAFAIRPDWTAEDLITASRELATAIVTEAKGDASQIEALLATQIKSAAEDIRDVETRMQTPAWRLADSLRQRVYETKIAVENSVGSNTREKLGELRCLLRLGIYFGSIQKQEAQQVLEYMRSLRPELFIDEPYDGFTRFASWLRAIFAPAPGMRARPTLSARSPPSVPHPFQARRDIDLRLRGRFELLHQLLRDDARALRPHVPVTEMRLVVQSQRSSSISSSLPVPRSDGMQPSTPFSTNTLHHSCPFTEWIVERIR